MFVGDQETCNYFAVMVMAVFSYKIEYVCRRPGNLLLFGCYGHDCFLLYFGVCL